MRRWLCLSVIAVAVIASGAAAVPTASFDDPPRPSASPAPAPAPPTSGPPAAPPRALAPAAPAPAPGGCVPSAERFLARARRHEARGDDAFAVREYTDAVQLDPACGAAWLGLAQARERAGDRVEAEALYGRAAQLRAVAPAALGGRGLLRWRDGRPEEALADLGAAYEQSGSERWRRELAARYVERRQWVAALALWRRRLAGVAPGSSDHREASLQVQALALLAGELDPVLDATSPRWERRSIARIATRASRSDAEAVER